MTSSANRQTDTGIVIQSSISTNHSQFVSKVISVKQTNPRQIDYTIMIKILINPKQQVQEVDFSYKPDEESLESVINEMIDALELNEDIHYQIIIHSIENALKTKQMKIVPPPIETQQVQNSNDIQNDTYAFSPLSPLKVSPRIMHRKSNAAFPDLRSNSMSESDAVSLIKEFKFDSNILDNTNNINTHDDTDDDLYDYLDSKDNSKSVLLSKDN